jgi:hypothetical protein
MEFLNWMIAAGRDALLKCGEISRNLYIRQPDTTMTSTAAQKYDQSTTRLSKPLVSLSIKAASPGESGRGVQPTSLQQLANDRLRHFANLR